MIRYFLAAVVLIAGLITASSFLIGEKTVLKPIRAALVIPEDGEKLEILTNFASSIKSVKSVCRFCCLEEEEAVYQLKNGMVQAVVVFPEHFYQDVDRGISTSVKLYLPEEMTTQTAAFAELLEDGISMLWTAEAGVFSILDQVEPGKTKIEYRHVGNFAAERYVEHMFRRSDLFRSEVSSPYGIYGKLPYYFSTGLLLFLMAAGMTFLPLYRKRGRAVGEKLCLYGISPVRAMAVRIFAVTNVLMAAASICYGGGCILTCVLDEISLYWDIRVLPGLYLLCTAFAVFYHIIYGVTGDVKAGIPVLASAELVLVSGSGMFIPLDYLPELFRKIGTYLPLCQWNAYNMDLLYGHLSAPGIAGMIGWIAAGLAAGIILCKKESRGILFH